MKQLETLATSLAQEMTQAVRSLPPNERGSQTPSILKEGSFSRHADYIAEVAGVEMLKRFSKEANMKIELVVDPLKGITKTIGEGDNAVFCYMDAVDGTVSVAGVGGPQYLANTGNWGTGVAFTLPTAKKVTDLRIGDFTIAAITNGNPRAERSAPAQVLATTYDTPKTIDGDGNKLQTSTQSKLSQSFVFYDAFQAFDRQSTGYPNTNAEQRAIALFGKLMNRNEGGAFDIKRDYGNLNALIENMLGWQNKESQGGGYIVLNENHANLIPSVPVVLGAGGIATDFEGAPLAHYSLSSKRPDVVYAANKQLHEQLMKLISSTK